jgi:hypothetical protein
MEINQRKKLREAVKKREAEAKKQSEYTTNKTEEEENLNRAKTEITQEREQAHDLKAWR